MFLIRYYVSLYLLYFSFFIYFFGNHLNIEIMYNMKSQIQNTQSLWDPIIYRTLTGPLKICYIAHAHTTTRMLEGSHLSSFQEDDVDYMWQATHFLISPPRASFRSLKFWMLRSCYATFCTLRKHLCTFYYFTSCWSCSEVCWFSIWKKFGFRDKK